MKKILFATFAIASVMVISGCASLDERLASNDPRVKNEAERELVQSSRENGDESMRVAAVRRVANKDFLYEIAATANNAERTAKGRTVNTIKEGLAAIGKLDGERVFLKLSVEAKSPEVRSASAAKIATMDGFVYLAEHSPDAAIRQMALGKLSDEKNLAHIVRHASVPAVRLAAYDKIQSQDTLIELLDGNTAIKDRKIVLSGIKRVNDKSKLLKIVFAPNASTRNTDAEQVSDIKYVRDRRGKMIPVRVPNKRATKPVVAKPVSTSTYDKEFVDAFIANCSNDSLLVKIVNEYGEGLSPEQCAAIKAKSKSVEVQNAIAAIADKKTLAELKKIEKTYDTYRQSYGKEEEEKRTYELLKEKFATLGSTELRMSLLDGWETMIRCDGSRYAIEFYSPFLLMLRDQEISYLFSKVEYENLQKIYIDAVPDENVLGQLVVLLKNGVEWSRIGHAFHWRTEKFRNAKAEELQKVFEALPQTLKQYELEGLLEMAADGSLDVTNVSKFKFEGVNNLTVRKVLKLVAQKLTPEAKKRLCAAARKKAEAQKGKDVVFGPFYLGMPYLDALLLQEEIWGVDNGVGIWSNFQEKGEHGIFDIASVWKLSFSNKAKFQFIDCKDSLVLPQFIHQFVEGKSGKVSSDFGYVSDIRREFGTDGDDRLYQAYSNTKRGIKVQYCPKDGVLNMVEL